MRLAPVRTRSSELLRDPVDRISMAAIPNVRLSLANRPENVLLVRQALSGLAEAIGLDPLELADVNTAVSEACNNVVLHAYGGDEGPLEVDVHVRAPGLLVAVRDRGHGIRPRADAAEDAIGGIGLPIIRALSLSVEFRKLAGEGTEVRMEFAAAGTGTLAWALDDRSEPPAVLNGQRPANTIELAIAPSALASAVLSRVLGVLAARARLSTDRISDTQLLADALVAQANGAIGAGHMSIAIAVAPRSLELRVGPLQAGLASTLVPDSTVDGLGSVLARLTDAQQVSAAGAAAEMLTLRLDES
jgi:serine/threonine-protein kinase RsbW